VPKATSKNVQHVEYVIAVPMVVLSTKYNIANAGAPIANATAIESIR
jgi:hypothetical protein